MLKKNKWLLLLVFFSHISSATQLSSIVEGMTKPIIIGDKKSGQLYVYIPTTKTVVHSPALFGSVISDEFNKGLYDKGGSKKITPAGTFIGHKYYSAHLHTNIIAFIEGNKSMVAIHPVWLGNPSQRRLDRLSSTTPEDNRITNGCVNVLPDFFNTFLSTIPNNTEVIMLKENDVLIDDITNSIGAELSQ